MDAVASALRAAGFSAEKSYYIGTDNPFANPVSVGDPRPNPRYDRLLEINEKFIKEATENANRQYNRNNFWNSFLNILGGVFTMNTDILMIKF